MKINFSDCGFVILFVLTAIIFLNGNYEITGWLTLLISLTAPWLMGKANQLDNRAEQNI